MPRVPPWKRAEARVAKLFGTVRRALSGGNSKSGGRDDSMHENLFISSKYSSRDSYPLFSLYKEEKEKADVEGKTVVMAFTKSYTNGHILAVHSDDFKQVAIEYLQANGYTITD